MTYDCPHNSENKKIGHKLILKFPLLYSNEHGKSGRRLDEWKEEKFEKLSNLICRYEDKDGAKGMRH